MSQTHPTDMSDVQLINEYKAAKALIVGRHPKDWESDYVDALAVELESRGFEEYVAP